MKKTFLLITVLTLITGSAFSQFIKKDSIKKSDEIKTVFGNKEVSHGGYGSLTIGYSKIDGQDAFITGARGSWVIGHSFALGIGGTGFGNDLYINNSPGSQKYSLEGGYGGLILEPILLPKFPIHLSFPVLLGAGGVAYINSMYYDSFDNDYYVEDSDAFFVAEPAVEIEMNLLKHIRLAVGASYRFTSDLHLASKPDHVLNGYNATFTLKFGKF